MVLVSHSHEFVFLKTRKTAGTSFEMMLEPYCTPPGHEVREKVPQMITEYGLVGARLHDGKIRPEWRNHAGAKKVFPFLGKEKWNRYLKITSVRNPFSRAISQFYWRFVWKSHQLKMPETFEEHQQQFSDFVFSEQYWDDYHIAHRFKKYTIDDAFRLEHLDEDFARIGARLGIELTKEKMPRTKENAGLKPDLNFIEFFTPAIEDEIRKKQAWVFDNFGYSPKVEDARL
ncbi:MAG: sulfotransferase family 2 domain-containing protein [Yoonia sp.]|uniref:sulfotransferase family 2 domain-containing protein n=1 Tax=Yoonia sp. TaxID=2212373 RepID=UPI003EF2E51A